MSLNQLTEEGYKKLCKRCEHFSRYTYKEEILSYCILNGLVHTKSDIYFVQNIYYLPERIILNDLFTIPDECPYILEHLMIEELGEIM
jgi:hypothetical protein